MTISPILLEGEVGSFAHGLNTETSDHDLIRLISEPIGSLLGVEPELGTERVRPQAEGERSQAGDTEITVYPLRKFVRMSMNGNPNIFPLLWTSMLTHADTCGIRGIREEFISRKAVSAHLGYASHLIMQSSGKGGQKIIRPDFAEKYGYDTKSAGHAVRFLIQILELITTGNMAMPMLPDNRDRIIGIREGKVSLEDVEDQVESLSARVREAEKDIRPEPDPDKVNEWLVDFYHRRNFVERAMRDR